MFEQPLSERMRAYLRIDFLYNQAVYHANSKSQWGSRAAIGSMLDILAIITRADTRADVLKELERQIGLLTEFQRRPGVDVERLQTLVANLQRLRTELLGAGLVAVGSGNDEVAGTHAATRACALGIRGLCTPAAQAWRNRNFRFSMLRQISSIWRALATGRPVPGPDHSFRFPLSATRFPLYVRAHARHPGIGPEGEGPADGLAGPAPGAGPH